ncbi:hypothetical protein ACIBL5_36270 [Streptomyces sp. NPDC050516]|uniref:hypothetical protein n=1 Tax=Streptomyces sp. NPDC050516 TaxID=3365621 RepID=UPI0037AAF4E5
MGSGGAFGSLIPVVADGISDVTVTATANMIPDSFHICQSIDYRLSWTKDGKDLAGTFDINALTPNKGDGQPYPNALQAVRHA